MNYKSSTNKRLVSFFLAVMMMFGCMETMAVAEAGGASGYFRTDLVLTNRGDSTTPGCLDVNVSAQLIAAIEPADGTTDSIEDISMYVLLPANAYVDVDNLDYTLYSWSEDRTDENISGCFSNAPYNFFDPSNPYGTGSYIPTQVDWRRETRHNGDIYPITLADNTVVSNANTYLKQHCVVSVHENYNDTTNTVIEFAFNFSDNPLLFSSIYKRGLLVDFGVSVPSFCELAIESAASLTGEDLAYNAYVYGGDNYHDSMNWNVATLNIAPTTTAYLAHVSTPETYNLFVCRDSSVAPASTYSYKYIIRTDGSHRARDISFVCPIENISNEWNGTFSSIDVLNATEVGVAYSTYYSVVSNPTDSDWTDICPANNGDVKCIKVVFTEILDESEYIAVVLNLTSVSDDNMLGKNTLGTCSISANIIDVANNYSAVAISETLVTPAITLANLNETGDLTLRAVDSSTGADIDGATFNVYKEAEAGEAAASSPMSVGLALTGQLASWGFSKVEAGHYKSIYNNGDYQYLVSEEQTFTEDTTISFEYALSGNNNELKYGYGQGPADINANGGEPINCSSYSRIQPEGYLDEADLTYETQTFTVPAGAFVIQFEYEADDALSFAHIRNITATNSAIGTVSLPIDTSWNTQMDFTFDGTRYKSPQNVPRAMMSSSFLALGGSTLSFDYAYSCSPTDMFGYAVSDSNDDYIGAGPVMMSPENNCTETDESQLSYTRAEVPITETGEYRLMVAYMKNDSAVSGLDAGFVKNLTLTTPSGSVRSLEIPTAPLRYIEESWKSYAEGIYRAAGDQNGANCETYLTTEEVTFDCETTVSFEYAYSVPPYGSGNLAVGYGSVDDFTHVQTFNFTQNGVEGETVDDLVYQTGSITLPAGTYTIVFRNHNDYRRSNYVDDTFLKNITATNPTIGTISLAVVDWTAPYGVERYGNGYRTLPGAEQSIQVNQSLCFPVDGTISFDYALSASQDDMIMYAVQGTNFSMRQIIPLSEDSTETTPAELVYTHVEIPVPAGVYMFGYGFIKGGSSTSGLDALYIKNIKYTTFFDEAAGGESVPENVLIATVTTNGAGFATIKNLPYGNYTVTEDLAPTGYSVDNSSNNVEILLDSSVNNVSVLNNRSRGSANLVVKDGAQDHLFVSGAVYELYENNGTLLSSHVTGADGIISLPNLEWGYYYLLPVSAGPGYLFSGSEDDQLDFYIGRDTLNDGVSLSTTNTQNPVTCTVTQQVVVGGTATPIPNSIYSLYKVNGDGTESLLRSGLTTNSNGQFVLDDLMVGVNYYLLETGANSSTCLDENKHYFGVTITDAINGYVADIVITVETKKGSAILNKKDEYNVLLNGAVFALYNSSDELVQDNLVTDANGQIFITNIEWGEYYLLETRAPKGYTISYERYPLKIDYNSCHELIVINVENERHVASVILHVADANNSSLPVVGATYSLYRYDGVLLRGGLVTDGEGNIAISHLAWNNYYFVEEMAPAGYILSSEKVRFSVNRQTTQSDQVLDTQNVAMTRSVTVTKRIKATDITYSEGTPVFAYKLLPVDGVSLYDVTHNAVIAFDKDYVDSYTDIEGYVERSVSFSDVSADVYKLVELSTIKYASDGIVDVVGGIVSGNDLNIDLRSNVVCEATFTAHRVNWEEATHSATSTGIIRTNKKLTGVVCYGDVISITSSNPEDIDTSGLDVYAVYDNGETQLINRRNALDVSSVGYDVDGTPIDISIYDTPFEVRVNYTENGITKSGSFLVIARSSALFTWHDAASEAVVIDGYLGNSPVVVFPSKIDGKRVKGLGNDYSTINGLDAATAIVIPEGISVIEPSAFEELSNITGTLVIPDTVKEIGSSAFRGWSGVTEVILGNGLYGDVAGLRFNNVTTLTAPISMRISSSDFPKLTSIHFTRGTGYGVLGGQFTGMPAHEFTVTFEEGILTIGESAFTTGLSSYPLKLVGELNFPTSLQQIGDGAFADCNGITKINIPAQGVKIGESAFTGLSGCGDITIGDNATIGKGAISGKSGSGGVLTLGNNAQLSSRSFQSCTFTSASIGSVSSSETELFYWCNFNNGITFTEDVTSITAGEFYSCKFLGENFTIPDHVAEIGDGAFSSCTGRGVLTIGGATIVGNSAFKGCSGFSQLVLGATELIGDSAFEDCTCFIGDLNIPTGTTVIGDSAFSGCSGFTGNLNIPVGVTTIGDNAFRECSGFTGALVVPVGVKTIGKYAFYNCSGFSGDMIVNASESISGCAFWGCGATGNLTINGLCSIGNAAFMDSPGTGSLIINGATDIGYRAFMNVDYSNLTLIGTEHIESRAFYDCQFTGNLILPEGLISIGDEVFQGSSVFNTIVIPGTLQSIGNTTIPLPLIDLYCPITVQMLEGVICGTIPQDSSFLIVHLTAGIDGIGYDYDTSAQSLWARLCSKSFYYGGHPHDFEIAYGAGGDAASFLIESGVVRIGDYTFSRAIERATEYIERPEYYPEATYTNIYRGIVLPNTIKEIGIYALAYCHVKISSWDTLETVGDYACYNSPMIDTPSEIVLTNAITIGNNAFNVSNKHSMVLSSMLCELPFDFSIMESSLLNPGTIRFGNRIETIGGSAFPSNFSLNTPGKYDERTPIYQFGWFTGYNSVERYMPNSSHIYNATTGVYIDRPYGTTTIGASNFNNAPITWSDTVTDLDSGLIYMEHSDYVEVVDAVNNGLYPNIIIPDTYNGKPITEIAPRAFLGNEVSNLQMGNNITTIGEMAFCGCSITSNAEDVIKPSVKTIGRYAFADNDITGTLVLGNNVIEIGEHAFENNALTGLSMADCMVQSVEPYTFANNDILGTLAFGSVLTTIKSNAFTENAIGVISFAGSGVTTIMESAFKQNGLTSVDFAHSNVETIGDSAFANNQIAAISFENSDVTSIGASAFANNVITGNVALGGGISAIGESAFINNNITGLLLSDCELETIEPSVFANNNLSSLSFAGSTIKTIGVSAFEHNSLVSVVFAGSNVEVIGNSAFAHNGLSSLTFVDSDVRTIDAVAFTDNELASVTFDGSSVETIGNYSFSNNLITGTLTFGNGVKTIGDYAFFNCPNINQIDLTNATQITETGVGCFALNVGTASSLTFVALGSNLKTVGDRTFEHQNAMASVNYGDSIETIGASAFNGCSALNNTIYAFPSSLKTIGTLAFGGTFCPAAGSSFLPNSITLVDGYAFRGCEGIVGTLVLPAQRVNYGDGVFEDCSNITDIVFPLSFTGIPKYFLAGTGISSIYIPDYITEVGYMAFHNTPLTEINLRVNLGIDDDHSSSQPADDSYINLTNITIRANSSDCSAKPVWMGASINSPTIIISDGSTQIPENMFYNYVGTIANLEIPESVTSINTRAFFGASNISAITIYNDSCTIASGSIPSAITIRGYTGSIAQAYANATGNAFVPIDMDAGEFNNFQYFVKTNNEATITGYTGSATTIAIPSTINGYPVKTIGKNAFKNHISLTSIDLSGVENIGDSAFYGCTGLTGINLSNVNNIGDSAFYSCTGLTGVNLSNVKNIGDSAFYSCTGLSGPFTISNTLENIGNNAFAQCVGITVDASTIFPSGMKSMGAHVFEPTALIGDLVLPTAIVSLPESAFEGYNNLTSVTFLGNIGVIPGSAFKNCSNITTVVLPSGVREIGAGAFLNCTAMTSIFNIQSVSVLGMCAFQGCSLLGGVLDIRNVSFVNVGAFSKCTSLAGVILSDNISIGDSAFEYCVNLVLDMSSLQHLGFGRYCFSGCTNLTGTVYFGGMYGERLPYSCFANTGITGVVIREQNNVSVAVFENCPMLTTVTLPISTGAKKLFDECYNIETVNILRGTGRGYNYSEGTTPWCDSPNASFNIEDGITYVGSYTFYGCQNIDDSYFPDVVEIGMHAFERSSIDSIGGFTSLEVIGNSAFSLSNITTLDWPASVSTIDNYAFEDCRNLTAFSFPPNVSIINSGVFRNCTGFVGDLVIPSHVVEIKNSAFEYANTTGGLVFEDGLTTIGESAFNYCNFNGLVVFPGTLTTVGAHAFDSCSGMVGNLILPDGLTSIGAYAFNNCLGLTGMLVIPNSMTEIPQYAFYGCPFTSADIGENIVTIRDHAINKGTLKNLTLPIVKDFDVTGLYCVYTGTATCLERITLTNNVGDASSFLSAGKSQKAPWSVTNGSTNNSCAVELIVQDGVTNIPDWMFYEQAALSGNVTLPASVSYIGNYSFYYTGIDTLTITNPDCVIYDAQSAICSPDITIRGYAGSTAEVWANAYGVPFEVIE